MEKRGDGWQELWPETSLPARINLTVVPDLWYEPDSFLFKTFVYLLGCMEF